MAHSAGGNFLGYNNEGGAFVRHSSHRGRPTSWLSVILVIIGFTMAGVALAMGPAWWLIIAGVVVMAVGAAVGAVADIFTDVVLDDPRYLAQEPHNTPLRKLKRVPTRFKEGEHPPRHPDRLV